MPNHAALTALMAVSVFRSVTMASMKRKEHIAVYCVGNRLMLDDGVGPAVYDELQHYVFPENVRLYDLGCLTLDRINDVRDFDLIITVDAVDGTDHRVGTIFQYAPQDMARRAFGTQSLHDLKLSDLFDSALLLGYECEGVCLGMQVQNATPAEVTIGLTEPVYDKLAELVDCVLAVLVSRGVEVYEKDTGVRVEPGYHHVVR